MVRLFRAAAVTVVKRPRRPRLPWPPGGSAAGPPGAPPGSPPNAALPGAAVAL